MIGFTCLEEYFSGFNITNKNYKFELYTDNFDKFSFIKMKDEFEEILDISNTTSEHL